MHRVITTLSLFVVLPMFLTAAPVQAAEPLQIGVAETDITPPEGFPMAGYYHERLATGVIDPLKAKAIVFRQGDRAAAWVAADVTGASRDLCVEVRKKAAAETGIPEQHISISATHSHTGPAYYRHLYEYLGGKTSAEESPFPAKLIEGIVAAIVAANGAVQPVVVKTGSGQQEVPVSFNRRFVMTDGSVQTWQRLDNPKVVRAAGPIDPEIGLAVVQSADDQKPVAVLSNFALHLDTVGGLLWSADYPYFIEQGVKKELGTDVISVFGTGCCGDINHSDPGRKERNKTDFIGNSLADTICAALPGLEMVETPTFQVRTAAVELPLQDVTDEQLQQAMELMPRAKAGEKTNFFDQVRATKAMVLDQLRNDPALVPSEEYISFGLSHAWGGIGESLPAEVMTVTVGNDLALVFLPGEIFVELGLAIKQGSPYRTTMVVELCNCVETIYVPTRAAYAGGSYEVTNSMVKPGTGEMLVETALGLLRESASAE
jgi:Neutral/alkaline non-lysosomal ceramidase, N-terminal